MASYSNNNRPSRLRQSDTVTFQLATGELVYTVIKLPRSGRIALRLPGDARNRLIFDALNISGADVSAMAQEAFGYSPEGSKWPRSNEGDYAAQCRLVNAIYDKLDTVDASDPIAQEAATDHTDNPAPMSLPAPAHVPAPLKMTAKELAPLEVTVGKFRMVIQVNTDGITISIR